MSEEMHSVGRDLNTTGATLFNSGSMKCFCCKSWNLKPTDVTEPKDVENSTNDRVLKFLTFINTGKIEAPPISSQDAQ